MVISPERPTLPLCNFAPIICRGWGFALTFQGPASQLSENDDIKKRAHPKQIQLWIAYFRVIIPSYTQNLRISNDKIAQCT